MRAQIPFAKAPLRLLTAAVVFAYVSLTGGVAQATLGGTAARGDNCTPVNMFAIGFPSLVPTDSALGPATIVNQSVILSRGWLLAGWILVSRDGHLTMAPYRLNGTEQPGLVGPPPVFGLADASIDTIREVYAAKRSSLMHTDMAQYARVEFLDDLGPFIVVPCFATSLPANR
jgi:hypothetical protein